MLDRPASSRRAVTSPRLRPVVVGLPGGDTVTLERGGLATSGIGTRRWLRGGLPQHHLIDPGTRRPAHSPWTSVTAVGRACLTADVAAKAGFLLGADGPAWLDERGVAARFVAGGRSSATSTGSGVSICEGAGVTASPVDWYAARAAGVLAYVLLTGGVLLGTLLAGRVRLPRWPTFAVTDVHRFVSLLIGVFVSVHVLTVGLDTYVHFSPAQLVVPGASSYRPLWVALGIVAAELLVAIAVTNLLRRRIGFKRWRRVHYLTFLVWAGATAHGLGSGTDANTTWLRFLYIALDRERPRRGLRGVSACSRLPAGSLVAPSVAAVVFGFALVLGLGKLPARGIGVTQSARRGDVSAGTRRGLVHGVGQGSSRAPGGALVSVVGGGSGQRKLLVRIDLVTLDGQQIVDTALQIEGMSPPMPSAPAPS